MLRRIIERWSVRATAEKEEMSTYSISRRCGEFDERRKEVGWEKAAKEFGICHEYANVEELKDDLNAHGRQHGNLMPWSAG